MRTGWLKDVGPWWPVIDAVVADVGLHAAAVYGRVWGDCQMHDGVCRVSLARIAEDVGLSRRTVQRHIKLLCEAGYLRDTTPGRRGAAHVYVDAGKVVVPGLAELWRESAQSWWEGEQ